MGWDHVTHGLINLAFMLIDSYTPKQAGIVAMNQFHFLFQSKLKFPSVCFFYIQPLLILENMRLTLII